MVPPAGPSTEEAVALAAPATMTTEKGLPSAAKTRLASPASATLTLRSMVPAAVAVTVAEYTLVVAL